MEVLGFLTTLVRIPVGIRTKVVVTIWFVAYFIVETIVAFLALVLMATFGKRDEIRASWLAEYPHSKPLWNTVERCRRILRWVWAD